MGRRKITHGGTVFFVFTDLGASYLAEPTLIRLDSPIPCTRKVSAGGSSLFKTVIKL